MKKEYCFSFGVKTIECPCVPIEIEDGCRVHVPVFRIHIWGGDTGYCPHCEMLGHGGINTAEMGFELQHPDGCIDEICEEYAAILMLHGIPTIWGYMFE